MASCMEQHCKHIVNWVKPHLQKSTWKQSLLDTEFGVPSVVLKLLRTWTWGGLSPYYNTTSIMMPTKFCELGFFLSKKLIKTVSIPHAAAWFLGFSSCVCSLFLLLLLYFPSSFRYTKHWYAFSLSECCFTLKKATKPERATPLHQRAALWHVAPTPTQKRAAAPAGQRVQKHGK